MKIRSIKTDKITAGSITLDEFLSKYLQDVIDGCIVAVTSKVLGIMEGRVVPVGDVEKDELLRQEAQYYLPSALNKYGLSFSINHHTLIPSAGIDESNGDGKYVLWPKDPTISANRIREFLHAKGLNRVGVVITDSTARPLHYGTEGIAIGYSGFLAIKDYVGQPDLFGRKLKASAANVPDALAAAAVMVMGEGDEQTPIAIIEDVPFVEFQSRNPTKEELDAFFLDHMNDDLFASFLTKMPWLPGNDTN